MRIGAPTFQLPMASPQSPTPLKKGANLEAKKKKLFETAKELESLFLYHVLKAMRNSIPKTANESALGLGGGMGKDIFTQIFDEELAKKISGNGDRSLAAILYRNLEKTLERSHASPKSAKPPTEAPPFPIKQSIPVPPFVKLEPISFTAEPPLTDLSESAASPLPPKLTDAVPPAPFAKESKPMVPFSPPSGLKSLRQNEAAISAADNEIMGRFGELITRTSAKYHLDPQLLSAVIEAESGGDPQAVSPAGAKGLMQLIDSTAAEMGVKDSLNPEENIEGGARYLRVLLDTFGDLKKALAAYNAGPTTVRKYGGIPPYRETKIYVDKIMKSLRSVQEPAQ